MDEIRKVREVRVGVLGFGEVKKDVNRSVGHISNKSIGNLNSSIASIQF